MLNTPWRSRHDELFDDCQALLERCEQCLAHLALIAADEDAIDCLQASLRALDARARAAAWHPLGDFTRALLLHLGALHPASLSGETLDTLRHCLSLLAWQVELTDPDSGELSMDDDEQHELLQRLALARQC